MRPRRSLTAEDQTQAVDHCRRLGAVWSCRRVKEPHDDVRDDYYPELTRLVNVVVYLGASLG